MDRPSASETKKSPQWLGPSSLPISLVVATRNRANRLEACLRAIAALDFDPQQWELIVVDNGSTDNTAEVVRAAQTYMPTMIKLVFEPARGASAARNAGSVVSSGAIVAFTDDDCYVAPDFLKKIVAAFARNPRLGWVTGRVELHDANDAPVTINTSKTPKHFRAKRFITTDDVIGANLSFRREALSAAGGYDERLGAGAPLVAAEDLDLTSSVGARGWEGAYDPDVVVSHHHGRKISEVAPLLKGYNIGRGAYTIKYLYRGQIIEFLRGVASIRWRLGFFKKEWLTREKRSMMFWETYGGFAYTGLRISQILRLQPAAKRSAASVTCFPPVASQLTEAAPGQRKIV